MKTTEYLRDVLSYNKGRGAEDGNNYWKRFTAARYVYVGVMLTLMSVGIGLVALLVGSSYPGSRGGNLFLSYFREPLILLLNILPALLLVVFFYFATGRAWAGFTGGAVVIFGFALVGFYKMSIRSETLVASDIGLIGEALGIISNYKIVISGRTILVFISFAAGLLFSIFCIKGRLRNRWVRLGGSLVSLGLMALILPTVYFSEAVEAKVTNDSASINIWVEQQVYASKGFVYSFLNSIPDAFPLPPDGYDEERAAALLGRYEDGAIDEGKRVNLIAVMLEAYTDLSEYQGVGVHEDVYAPLHKLQSESLHGRLIVNVSGGGTVDTERGFLTGYTINEEYRTPTDSYIYFLRRNGYYAEGLHTGNGWFYNRENVERNLGTQNYYFLDDYNSTDFSDEFFFARLSELIAARDKDVPYFNFSVTYQNHGAYDSASTGDISYLDGSFSDEDYNILNNYLTGIADTGRRMLDFVDSLRDDPEPFVVVFFGDHKPYLGYALNNAGVNLDLGTVEGFYNYYSTPYIIWANDAAKAATGGDFSGQGGDISPCYLMDAVFDECGWGKSAFMQFTHDIREHIDIVNTGTDTFRVDGELTRAPSGVAAEMIENYEFVQYYSKRNFTYKELYGG